MPRLRGSPRSLLSCHSPDLSMELPATENTLDTLLPHTQNLESEMLAWNASLGEKGAPKLSNQTMISQTALNVKEKKIHNGKSIHY